MLTSTTLSSQDSLTTGQDHDVYNDDSPEETVAVEIPNAGVTVVQPLGTPNSTAGAVRRSQEGSSIEGEESKDGEEDEGSSGGNPASKVHQHQPSPALHSLGPSFDQVLQWTAQDVANYMTKSFGEPEAAKLCLAADVDGLAFFELDERALRDIGLDRVGARKRVHRKIRTLLKSIQTDWRKEELWSSTQYRPPCVKCLPYGFPCCCSCCIGYPSTYRLTRSRLSIVTRDGLCMGVCAPLIITDNADLSYVTDVDLVTYTPCLAQCCPCCSCCVVTPSGVVSLSTVDGIKNLYLKEDEAARISSQIVDSVESTQLQFVSERALLMSGINL